MLERWWFDFDIPPRSPELSEIRILNEFPDTDAGMRHLLGRGVGVTGFEYDDCVGLIARLLEQMVTDYAHAGRPVLPIVLPPIRSATPDPDLAELQKTKHGEFGIAAIRGVWYPRPARLI